MHRFAVASTATMPRRNALPTLLVTGAAGNMGRALVRHMASQYRGKANVIAGVHTQPSQADIDSLRSITASIVELDYNDAAVMQTALRPLHAIDLLFLVPSHAENRAAQARAVVEAARSKGLRFVVLVSLLGCDARAGMFASQARDIEEYIEGSGIQYAFLRCAPFQQNYAALVDAFRSPIPTLALPISQGAYAPIHVSDVAAAAAVLFASPADHYGKSYTLTGPEVLTGVAIAGKASRGLDRPVRFVNCDIRRAREDMIRASSPEWFITGFLELYAMIAKGLFDVVSPDLAMLTCFKGVTLEEFFRENRAFFGQAVTPAATPAPASSSSSASSTGSVSASRLASLASTAPMPSAMTLASHGRTPRVSRLAKL
ncbi:hypothetical protein BC831DRAFT_458216 [Entophlyctis helioformis]|nr:hypothetical protein BC831DRAFT_458216 [Entophlyctis helioformis]